ncbi:MAG: lipocalin-like domain-containing protein [Rhodocyclaceae bacterium]|nr:lipocalin-like domain-containing protein [Rhodocyclaceae bacterium]
MIKCVLTAFIVCSSILFTDQVLAQGSSQSIIGVWKVATVETREVVAGKVVKPFGETPSGTFVFTAGGQMIGMQYASNRKAPAAANPTEAERAALHASMSAYSGRYRVEGWKLFITIEESSIQSWNGTVRVINLETDGKRLTGTSEPFKSLITGLDVVAVVIWERIE